MADFDFTTAEIEDGTGKTTAKVYFDTDIAIAWLNNRGKTSLSGGTEATQEAAMLMGHEMLEDALMEAGFRGSQATAGQGLLFPSWGAFDSEGIEIEFDEIPAEAATSRGMQRYFEALCLAIEKAHLGKLESAAAASGLLGQIESTSRRGHTVKFKADTNVDFATSHPEIWRKARAALPPPRIAWAM